MIKKDVVAGLGEIGGPIFNLLSKARPTLGYDINPKLMDKKNNEEYARLPTFFMHVCIPFTTKFISNVISLYRKFSPEAVVIHSTISPHATNKIQDMLPVPVIYSATRGVHRRMLYDLKRYVKFFAIEPKAPRKNWAILSYARLMKQCGVKTRRMSNPLTLELAKIICDTSYYGWLINYAQLSNMIAIKHKVDYDEMWTFADEIHKYLGNRPKMYPGIIGGHCVIPNLALMNDDTLNLIKEINSDYARILKGRRVRQKKN